jgi:hypothetical protein
MVSVVYAECLKYALNAECLKYALNAECLKYALNAECHYAECRYAECHGTFVLAKSLERRAKSKKAFLNFCSCH